jgi:hypothetical protein
MNTQIDEGNPITVKYPQILTSVTGATQLCQLVDKMAAKASLYCDVIV